jgi:hypothetical protein
MTLCEQVLYHAHGGDEKGITTTRQGAQGEALCSAPALPASHEYTSQNENGLSS